MISYRSLESIRGHLCVKRDEGGREDEKQLTKLISVVENEMEIQEQLTDDGYRQIVTSENWDRATLPREAEDA